MIEMFDSMEEILLGGGIDVLQRTDLSLDLFLNMRQCYFDDFPNRSKMESWLIGYYGTYNCAVAVHLQLFTMIIDMSSETIADITFNYPNRNYIRIFKNDTFCRIQEAYDLGFLTLEDIIEIKAAYDASRDPIG